MRESLDLLRPPDDVERQHVLIRLRDIVVKLRGKLQQLLRIRHEPFLPLVIPHTSLFLRCTTHRGIF